LPTLAGAGALRSTVNDMLKFVAANLGADEITIARRDAEGQQSQRETGQPIYRLALIGTS
jgi:CubicO group peptidase (beta-lactamase class C family)